MASLLPWYLADEVAKWPAGNVHAMISALETSRGKIPNSRMLWLGTRPASGTHPFEKMLLPGGADYRQVHAAAPDRGQPLEHQNMEEG